MVNVPPNYSQGGPGALVTSRYDFLSHYEGLAFRHTADQIDLLQSLVIGLNTYTNVETAIFGLYNLINTSSNIFSTNPGPFEFLITSQSPGTSFTIENDAGSHSHTKVSILDNNVLQAAIGNLGIVSGTASFAAIWLGNSINPNTNNYVLACNGSNTYLNVPSGGVMQFQGGGTSVYATLGPTSLDMFSQFIFFDASITTFVGIGWTSTATAAGHDMYITGQGAGGTGNAGGNINLDPGPGTTSGTPGSLNVNIAAHGAGSKNGTFVIKDGANTQCIIANYGAASGSTANAALWLGPTVANPPTINTYALLSDGVNLTVNSPGGTLSLGTGGLPYAQLTSTTFTTGSVSITSTGVGGISGSSTAFGYQSTTVSITNGGSNTLTASQYAHPYISVTGTITVNTSITFPNITGAWFILNTQNLIYGGNHLTIVSGTGSRTVNTTALGVYLIVCNGFNQVFVTTMS